MITTLKLITDHEIARPISIATAKKPAYENARATPRRKLGILPPPRHIPLFAMLSAFRLQEGKFLWRHANLTPDLL